MSHYPIPMGTVQSRRPEPAILTANCRHARRNHALGLWAGGRLGLTGRALDTYTARLVAADALGDRTDSLVRQVMDDLRRVDPFISDREIRIRLKRFEQDAALAVA
jgi:hypothetical protein